MSIIKHAMLFNYFQQAGQGNEAYRDELEHSDDMIQTITHLANQEQVTVPYLMPLTLIGDNVSATLATALDVEEEDVTFYPFVVAEPRSFSRRRLNIHVFALMADNRMFCHSFDPVFELRVQNHAGEWQAWQAIVGRFVIVKVDVTDGHTAIADLTQADLAKFRSICQIRYSGTLNVDFYGNPSIFDSIAGFGVCRNINRGTLAIEFDPQGNAEAPFAERCADWQKFEERYQPNNLDVR